MDLGKTRSFGVFCALPGLCKNDRFNQEIPQSLHVVKAGLNYRLMPAR